jgi:hypothetical protein
VIGLSHRRWQRAHAAFFRIACDVLRIDQRQILTQAASIGRPLRNCGIRLQSFLHRCGEIPHARAGGHYLMANVSRSRNPYDARLSAHSCSAVSWIPPQWHPICVRSIFVGGDFIEEEGPVHETREKIMQVIIRSPAVRLRKSCSNVPTSHGIRCFARSIA